MRQNGDRWEVTAVNETNTESCHFPLFCCPQSSNATTVACDPEDELVDCTRAIWKQADVSSMQTPGIRSGHQTVVIGDEVYLFGGASPTLQPETLHILNIKDISYRIGSGGFPSLLAVSKNSELVFIFTEALDNSSLHSGFPSSTDRHLRYRFMIRTSTHSGIPIMNRFVFTTIRSPTPARGCT
jgi:hypothetical protein